MSKVAVGSGNKAKILAAGDTNGKEGDGYFGKMTNNAITRPTGYRDGIIMALASFIHPTFFI